MNKRVDADQIVDMWCRLGPAGGAATPHIPAEPASDLFAAFATASTATLDAWAREWPKPLRLEPEEARQANAPR